MEYRPKPKEIAQATLTVTCALAFTASPLVALTGYGLVANGVENADDSKVNGYPSGSTRLELACEMPDQIPTVQAGEAIAVPVTAQCVKIR